MKLHQRFLKQYEDEYGFAGDEGNYGEEEFGYAGGDIKKGGNSGIWGRKSGKAVGRQQFAKNQQAQTTIRVINYRANDLNYEFFNANNTIARYANPDRYISSNSAVAQPLNSAIILFQLANTTSSGDPIPYGLWFFDKNKDLVYVDNSKADNSGPVLTSDLNNYISTGIDSSGIVSLRITMAGQGSLSYERFLAKLLTTSFYVNKIIITTTQDVFFQSSVTAKLFTLLEAESVDGFSLQSADNEMIQNTKTRTFAEGKQADMPITVDSNYALFATAPANSSTTWLLFFDTIFDHTKSLDV